MTVNFQDSLVRLTEIGIALSVEQDLHTLLDKILSEARAFTQAEAGSLYLRDGDSLIFLISHNDALSRDFGKGNTGRYLKEERLPLTTRSMAGYVGVTGEVVKIDDVYDLPEDCPFTFDDHFDKKNKYRSRSMLLIPMREPAGSVVGVLQLINSLDPDGNSIPFNNALENLCLSLASQAAVAIRNAKLAEELKTAYKDTIFRLSMAAEYRDDDTAQHLHRMSKYCAIVARQLGLGDDQVEHIEFASPMHDVGKIGVPDAILLKPGKLTDDEFRIMQQHTVIGAKILGGSDSQILRLSAVIALTHHEKFNGKGYPNGLKGEAIPLVGRIVAVADVFDALTSKRCYKPAFSVEKATGIIREERGEHFDPNVVDAFFDAFHEIMAVKRLHQDTEEE
jgi:GAF domain-containing protein